MYLHKNPDLVQNNPKQLGIPALTGVVALNDINDRRTLAIVDGAYITATRTGAAERVSEPEAIGSALDKAQVQSTSYVLDILVDKEEEPIFR